MWKLSTFISIFLQAFDWFFNFLFYTGVINNVVLISGVEQNDSVIRIYVSVKWKPPSYVRLFPTPWSIQSMEFSRPEYWSGWPFFSPGVLPMFMVILHKEPDSHKSMGSQKIRHDWGTNTFTFFTQRICKNPLISKRIWKVKIAEPVSLNDP